MNAQDIIRKVNKAITLNESSGGSLYFYFKKRKPRKVTLADAKIIGDQLGIDWNEVDLEQFRQGIRVEMEHSTGDPQTDVAHDNMLIIGKIALAHLKELPDYYSRLMAMESEKL